jgi:hypothetical protein
MTIQELMKYYSEYEIGILNQTICHNSDLHEHLRFIILDYTYSNSPKGCKLSNSIGYKCIDFNSCTDCCNSVLEYISHRI